MAQNTIWSLFHPPILVDQTLQESIGLLSEPSHPLLITVTSKPIQNRQEIPGIRRPTVGVSLLHDVPKKPSLFLVGNLVAVVPFPCQHPHYDVERQLGEN